MGKSEKSTKRKLSDTTDDIDYSAAPAKKLKKDKKDKKDGKKDKKTKHGDKKSRKEIKAEQADDLNHAEYDVEDKAIEESEPAPVKTEIEEKPKKEKKGKKDKTVKTDVNTEEVQQVNGGVDAAPAKKKSKKVKAAVQEEHINGDDKGPTINGDKDSTTEKSKKSKKDKEDKKIQVDSKVDLKSETDGGAGEPSTMTSVVPKKTNLKKEKKSKKLKKDKSANGIEIKDSDNKLKGAAAAATAAANGEANGEGMSSKNNRFICFIGNLPFTATKADIEAHFTSLHPISVRLLTEKDAPTRSRGVAFIEFDHFSRMKTCLAKFHHTDFTDAAGTMRKINVELTAGGGGKTAGRMDKVKDRNFRLNEERTRRIAKEEAEKEEARKNGGGGKKAAAEVKKEAAEDPREDAYVHPSRRVYVPARKN